MKNKYNIIFLKERAEKIMLAHMSDNSEEIEKIEIEEINISNSFLTSQYMPRPRVNRILDQATRCKLVYVIAGAGYGKTLAVRHYIEQYPDAVIRWVQLTENDNIGSYYWENLTHNISFDNPELTVKLCELGFPETLARFKQFAEILRSTEHRSAKTFLVLDDFHLIHSKQALTFAERCAYLQIPGACVIIISRKEPEINTVSLFSKGQVSIITEEELRFTDDEIADFMKYVSIPCSVKEFPLLVDATKGWAIAIQLLTLVLKRNQGLHNNPDNPMNLAFSLDVMKQNIFKLLETEAFNDFSEKIQKALVKMSLASNLPLTVLQKLLYGTNGISFLRDAPQLASFIWFDSLIGDYRVHPLYLEFLQSRHDILSFEEKQITYHKAAQWCSENSFYMDAMNYFAKSRQYERMLETLVSYRFKLPYDTCEYFLNLLEELKEFEELEEFEEESDSDNKDNKDRVRYSFLLLKNFFIPLILVWMGKYEEARERSFDVIRKWGRSDSPFAPNLICASYSNLGYIDMYTCTGTHKYEAAEYLKKSAEYFKLSSVPLPEVSEAFAVADIRSFACLVGENAELDEFDQFLEAARQSVCYVTEIYHNIYYGYDDLVACEIAFFKNQPETAKNYARQAILKARERKQYSIGMMAAQYLLRIAMQEGDYPLVKEILKPESRVSDAPDFWGRQMLNDYFYIQTGIKTAPPWFVLDEKESAAEVRIPTRELLVGVKYYFALKKYSHALTFLGNLTPVNPQERFLFGELTLSLLTAVAKIKTGDARGAVKDFDKAYSLSFNGVFEMPFVERGKDLHPLAVAALKQGDCGIPDNWLKKIDRKASVYAKKAAFIINSFKREKNIEDAVRLSDREREVLNDLYHGLSREEIAISRYLSINTVHKIIQSIFIKLDAYNNVDAIRIAGEKNLLN